MKTQNKKLAFRKNAVIELNRLELVEINGGTTLPCGASVVAAIGAAAAVVGGLIVVANDAGQAVGEAISRAVD